MNAKGARTKMVKSIETLKKQLESIDVILKAVNVVWDDIAS